MDKAFEQFLVRYANFNGLSRRVVLQIPIFNEWNILLSSYDPNGAHKAREPNRERYRRQ